MSTPQKTVLIVDDELDAVELFAEMMRLNEYRVIRSYSGPPALDLIEQERPDVVILDIMMPEMTGLEVLRSMRADARIALIPVVVVSAKARPADIAAGMEAGATIYLTKPVGYLDLKNAVDSVLHA
jgi:two-component system phosphate regulon response regulator PhoB